MEIVTVFKDSELYKKYNAYFKDALEKLNQLSGSGEKIRTDSDEDIEFVLEEGSSRNYNGFRTFNVSKKDYMNFVFKNKEALENLESYKQYAHYLLDKKYMTPRHLDEEQGFCINILIKYGELSEGFNYNQERIDEIYRDIEAFIFSDEIKFCSSAKLYGFKSDVDDIAIDDFIIIKKYGTDECRKIWRESYIERSLLNIIYPSDFKIEVTCYKKKDRLRYYGSETIEWIKKTVLLLRLFKSSDLKIDVIKTRASQWTPIGGISSTGFTEHEIGGSYDLTSSELPNLISLWHIIKNINFSNCPALEIAIHRFQFAHERDTIEDRLIDIMIGFEALYLQDDKEIRYKTSLRPAILLGKSLDEKRGIFKIMQAAYDKRSEVVHGKKLEKKIKITEPINKEITTYELIKYIKDYLSLSIRTFARLSNDYTDDQILNKIHDTALTAEVSL